MDYSIIIPAYNEAVWLKQTLTNLGHAMSAVPMRGEVIVVDNNSSDPTPQVARDMGARVVFEPHNQISRARNTGARAAHGAHFIFLDADTQLPPDLLHVALARLAGGRCCGGGARVEFDRPVAGYGRMALNLWNGLSRRFGLAAGCFIYCLRQGFEAVGGFSTKIFAGEEVAFSLQMTSWGQPRGLAFDVIPWPAVITSSRKLDWFSPLELGLTVLMFALFPLAIKSRALCRHWYYRPPDDRRS